MNETPNNTVQTEQSFVSTTPTKQAVENADETKQGEQRCMQMEGNVDALAYHPTQPWIAVVQENSILIKHCTTGAVIGQPMTGHTRDVMSVAFSPDGAYLVSGSRDKTVRLWDTHTQRPIGKPMAAHKGCVSSVAFSPDGLYLASGSWDKTVRLWDRKRQKSIGQPMKMHTGIVTSVAFSPDGACLASSSFDKTLRLWDSKSQKPIGQAIAGHSSHVITLAFSPEGNYLASGSSDKTVRLWDRQTQQPIGQAMTGHTDTVMSVAFSHDGSSLVSGSADNSLRIWNRETQALTAQMNGHIRSVKTVVFSADDAHVLSGGEDNTVRTWDNPQYPQAMRSSISSEGAYRASNSFGHIFRPLLLGETRSSGAQRSDASPRLLNEMGTNNEKMTALEQSIVSPTLSTATALLQPLVESKNPSQNSGFLSSFWKKNSRSSQPPSPTSTKLFSAQSKADSKTQSLLNELLYLIDEIYPETNVACAKERLAILSLLKPYQDRQASLMKEDALELNKCKRFLTEAHGYKTSVCLGWC